MEDKELIKDVDSEAKAPRRGGRSSKTKFAHGKGNRGFKGKPGNDFSFWNEYPELMSIATRFPWMHIAGTPLEGDGILVNLPNVAIQHFYPIPGYQAGATSPLNLAFRQMYLDMHRRYRGIGTYQASDIAITMLCIESVLQKLVEAERIYGILNTYPIKTRIQPEGLLKAIGYDDSFIANVAAHRADFRYGLNRLIHLASRLPLPNGMSFFVNHVSLNGFVYKDSQDERADLIVFVCDGFFRYATTGDPDCINGAGTAIYTPFERSTFATYEELLQDIENDLNTLLYDSDILRITSDFIACYGENNMQVLSPVPEDYVVLPQYSESILSKWHNSERYVFGTMYLGYELASATTTAITPRANLFAVYQEKDTIYSKPVLFNGSGVPTWETYEGTIKGLASTVDYTNVMETATAHVVDTWMENPSEEIICEAMLWKCNTKRWVKSDNTKYALRIIGCATELLGKLELARVTRGTVYNRQQIYATYNNAMAINAMGQNAVCLSQFDWAPYLLFENTSTHQLADVFGDTDNVSIVSVDTIGKIHDAALLSAFKVKVSASGGAN